MKRFGKLIGSSMLIVASLFMLTSLLSCNNGNSKKPGDKPNTPGGGGTDPKTETFEVKFAVAPAGKATLTAKVDGKDIKSGDKVEKDKEVVFTLSVTDVKYAYSKWEGEGLTNTTATGAKLKVTKNADIKAVLRDNGNSETKEDSELKLTKLEYKKADNSKEDITTTKAFTVENGVKTLAKTDFTATFEYGDGTNKKTEPIEISSVKKSDGTELGELQEGENKITLVVDAKKGSYKGTSIPVTVTRKPDPNADPKLELESLKYDNGEELKKADGTIEMSVKQTEETLDLAKFVAKFKGKNAGEIKFNEIIYEEGKTKLGPGKNIVKLKVNGVSGSYADTIITIEVTKPAGKYKLTFRVESTDQSLGTISMSARQGENETVESNTDIAEGTDLTFTLKASMSVLQKIQGNEYEITWKGATRQENYHIKASTEMPASDLEVVATITKK